MTSSETLFHRLGGRDGIARLVDDIVIAHLENPQIKARFLPLLSDPPRVAAIKQHTCQFLEAGSGGTATYEGRSMRAAHTGMNVSAAEYMAAVDDIMLVLRKHGIDEATQKDVLAIAYSLKGEILHV